MSINYKTLAFAACLCGTIAFAIVIPETSAFKFEKGQKLKYETTSVATTDGGGGVMEMETVTVTEYTVLEMGKDGARMQSRILKDSAGSDSDHQMPSREGFTREFTVSMFGMGSHYKTTDAAEAHMVDDDPKFSEPAFGLTLPKSDLKDGATWKVTHTMQGGESNVKVTYKVEGFETIDGNKVAVITSKAKGDGAAILRSNIGEIEADMTLEETAKYYFDMERGLVIKSERKAEVAIFSEHGEFYQTRNVKSKLTK